MLQKNKKTGVRSMNVVENLFSYYFVNEYDKSVFPHCPTTMEKTMARKNQNKRQMNVNQSDFITFAVKHVQATTDLLIQLSAVETEDMSLTHVHLYWTV